MNKKELQNLLRYLPCHPGIMGKERYLNAAVLIPLIEKDNEYHFVFQKRAANIRQGGEISFPGGRFEPNTDNNCKEAAIREASEELGIEKDIINIQARLDTLISPRGISVDSFLAILEINGIEDMVPDKKEVEDVFLLPVSWFKHNSPQIYTLKHVIKPSYINKQGHCIKLLPVKELGLPSHYREPWTGMEHKVFVYHTPKALIWGITAELVYYLIKKY